MFTRHVNRDPHYLGTLRTYFNILIFIYIFFPLSSNAFGRPILGTIVFASFLFEGTYNYEIHCRYYIEYSLPRDLDELKIPTADAIKLITVDWFNGLTKDCIFVKYIPCEWCGVYWTFVNIVTTILFNIINCQSYNIYLNCKNYYSSFTINKIFWNRTNRFGTLLNYIIYSVIADVNSPTRFSIIWSRLNLRIISYCVRVLRVSIFPKRVRLILL